MKNISFDLHRGEILAVLGKSGSGKTTLIKILAGLMEPDKGEVLFHEKKLEGPNDKLVPGHEEIRLVYQDFKLYHNMRVHENLKNALIQYVTDYREERTADLLELCRLQHVKDQFVHELSGGEKQRVAIAMALSTEPEVLLFDEPFSNLDFTNKTNLLDEIETIARQTETSVILITHDSRDAMEIADHLIVLHEGDLIRRGATREVYRNPLRKEVADLLGLYSKVPDRTLSAYNLSDGDYGVWAEDVLLHKPDGMQGRIKKVMFSGMTNKILIAARDFDLWAYDHSKKLKSRDKIKFSLRVENLFPLR